MFECCTAARNELVCEHEERHAQLPHSRLSEWCSTPAAGSLVGRHPLALEHDARDPLGSLPRVRTEAHGGGSLALADAVEAHRGARMARGDTRNLFHAVPAGSGYGVW